MNRSGTPEAAADVLRLRLNPAWLDYVTTNNPPSRAEFERTYGEFFPDATFSDLGPVAAAMHWRRPSAGRRDFE